MTDEDNTEDAGAEILSAEVTASGIRLDKALSDAFPTLSRARLQALLAEGAVSKDGQVLTSGKAKATCGTYTITLPPVSPAEPQPENIPLNVLYEDAHLIVINKPSGMAAHPAPGCESGTLVNALLYHCGETLSGIGGVARPGIVHRLDKDTSGVMVAAKTDEAHQGLSALFAKHDIERTYIALTRGTPNALSGRIDTQIGRSLHDRKKMAVLKHGGRQAITDYVVQKTYGQPAKASGAPLASRIACTLHTGRTHQIRVHMASVGAPLLGDPVYGSGAAAIPVRTILDDLNFTRQALHAAILGFVHPVTGEALRFETAPPADMQALEARLCALD